MFYDDLEGWGGVGGRKAEEGEGRCTHIVDSHCHTAETNTTLQSNYTPIISILLKNLKLNKEC